MTEAWVPLDWTVAAVWIGVLVLLFLWWLYEVRRAHFPRRPRRRKRPRP